MARHFGGWLQLGIRPFDDPVEHWAWQPGLEDAGGDPVWVVLREGTACLIRSGHLTEEELVALIDAVCGGRPKDDPRPGGPRVGFVTVR
jgi:hypothetical protein